MLEPNRSRGKGVAHSRRRFTRLDRTEYRHHQKPVTVLAETQGGCTQCYHLAGVPAQQSVA
jgi:hypothetical protein